MPGNTASEPRAAPRATVPLQTPSALRKRAGAGGAETRSWGPKMAGFWGAKNGRDGGGSRKRTLQCRPDRRAAACSGSSSAATPPPLGRRCRRSACCARCAARARARQTSGRKKTLKFGRPKPRSGSNKKAPAFSVLRIGAQPAGQPPGRSPERRPGRRLAAARDVLAPGRPIQTPQLLMCGP